MPKTKAKAFENIKSGDVIEITLPLTHKRSGDNNSLIAYYPVINGNEKVGIPNIKKLIERGMVLEELKNSDAYVETLSKENKRLEKLQKEFLKFLEDESKEIYRDGGLRQNIFKQVLQKYKSILGYKDEQN